MQVRSLGWGDPLEEGMATPPVFLPGEPGGREPRGYSPYGGKESDVTEATGHAYTSTIESTHLTQT